MIFHSYHTLLFDTMSQTEEQTIVSPKVPEPTIEKKVERKTFGTLNDFALKIPTCKKNAKCCLDESKERAHSVEDNSSLFDKALNEEISRETDSIPSCENCALGECHIHGEAPTFFAQVERMKHYKESIMHDDHVWSQMIVNIIKLAEEYKVIMHHKRYYCHIPEPSKPTHKNDLLKSGIQQHKDDKIIFVRKEPVEARITKKHEKSALYRKDFDNMFKEYLNIPFIKDLRTCLNKEDLIEEMFCHTYFIATEKGMFLCIRIYEGYLYLQEKKKDKEKDKDKDSWLHFGLSCYPKIQHSIESVSSTLLSEENVKMLQEFDTSVVHSKSDFGDIIRKKINKDWVEKYWK